MKPFTANAALVLGLLAAGVLPAQDPPAARPPQETPPAPPAAPGETPAGPVVDVMLRTKERIRGRLEIPTGDRDGFLLYMDGGPIPIRFLWAEVEEADARRLQSRAGLLPAAETAAKQYTVRGVRVLLKDKRTLEGIEDIVLSTDSTLILKHAGGKTQVARDQIVGREETELPLSRVYTPKEVYDLLLQTYQPQDEKQWEAVGGELMHMGQWDRARDVFRTIEILKRRDLPVNRFYTDLVRIREQLETTEAKVAAFELARRVLDERYEEAMGLLRQIEESNRSEAVAAEIRKLRATVEALRERTLEDRLVDEGYTQIRSLLTVKAVDRSVGFTDAAAYADKTLYGETMERLAAQYHLDRPSVERVWSHRPNARLFLARYGEGTWIQARPGSTDQEGWWHAASNMARFEYLEARFAEKFLRVVKASDAHCPQCGGQGTVSEQVSTTPAGGMCPACLGAKVSRVVFYR